ncbi:MAG: adenylyltransferase/cytidyltransferase family protein [Microscillaceae bacterium]|nr:adenylyltransferase/cytidyltransferase family protein [Microscillaceae bacterium]
MDALYAQYAPVLAEYGIDDLAPILNAWREPHRHYHTEAHLQYLLKAIAQLQENSQLTEENQKVLVMTAFFHDIVYDPLRQDNEEQSAALFAAMTQPHPKADLVQKIILDTRHHEPTEALSRQFSELDMHIVTQADFPALLRWERAIFKEYQYLDYPVYREGRLALLAHFINKYPQNAQNLRYLHEYVQQYRPKIGIYAGSFHPFHHGHLNILEKAETIFDKVIVARGINPDKADVNENPLNLNTLRYRQTDNFSGFLTKYITSKETDADVTLVRGLRNGDDLDYEVNQLRFMQDMKENLKVIFLPCDKEFEHISSSSIKNLDRIDPNFSRKYMPE